MKNKFSRRSGFTLVELLAVMAVIGVLAGMVLGISGYASRRADESKAMADIERIKDVLEAHRIDTGAYPSQDQFRDRIRERDRTFYDETDGLKDPWGRDYQYSREGRFRIYVYSFGPTGQGNRDDYIYTGERPPE